MGSEEPVGVCRGRTVCQSSVLRPVEVGVVPKSPSLLPVQDLSETDRHVRGRWASRSQSDVYELLVRVQVETEEFGSSFDRGPGEGQFGDSGTGVRSTDITTRPRGLRSVWSHGKEVVTSLTTNRSYPSYTNTFTRVRTCIHVHTRIHT